MGWEGANMGVHEWVQGLMAAFQEAQDQERQARQDHTFQATGDSQQTLMGTHVIKALQVTPPLPFACCPLLFYAAFCMLPFVLFCCLLHAALCSFLLPSACCPLQSPHSPLVLTFASVLPFAAFCMLPVLQLELLNVDRH